MEPVVTEPVSYTHLDVYKRQLGILSEASGKPHAQAVGAIVSTLAIPEQMIVHAPYAVSYTHLSLRSR